MAYMNGDYYVWSGEWGVGGEENLHIWAANGYDGWDETGWACDEDLRRHPGKENAGGVCLPMQVMDELVMMRLTQIIHEGLAEATIDRAVEHHGRNYGGMLLAKNAERLKDALRRVQFEDPDPVQLPPGGGSR